MQRKELNMSEPKAPEVNEPIAPEIKAEEKPAEEIASIETSESPAENPEEKTEDKKEDAKKSEDSGLVRHLRKTIDHQGKRLRDLERAMVQAQEIPQPVKEQFTDDAEFVKANQAFQAKQVQRNQNEMQRIIEDTTAEYEDFSIDSIGHLNFHIPTLVEAVNTLQHGKDILYHLSKNPEEASELSLLSKSSPALFEQKLVELHTSIRKAKQAPVKRVSSAPKPVKPVNGRAAARVEPSKMSDKEWLDWKRNERFNTFKQKMGVT
jgi:hypothetical protein